MEALFQERCDVHSPAGIDLDAVIKSVLRLARSHEVSIDSNYAELVCVCVCVCVVGWGGVWKGKGGRRVGRRANLKAAGQGRTSIIPTSSAPPPGG